MAVSVRENHTHPHTDTHASTFAIYVFISIDWKTLMYSQNSFKKKVNKNIKGLVLTIKNQIHARALHSHSQTPPYLHARGVHTDTRTSKDTLDLGWALIGVRERE